MNKLTILFITLFVASFGLYLLFVQQLATALGIDHKTIGLAELIEGGGIALLVSGPIWLVALAIAKALRSKSKKAE